MSPSLSTTIRDLQRRRGRERRGLALAEGVRLVEEALAAGVEVRGAAVSPSLEATLRGVALKDALRGRGVRLEELEDPALGKLADTDTPQGVIAVIAPRLWTLEDIPVGPRSAVLVLDGVQDPGNVGTLCRTAHGLGAAGVVALAGTADLVNPKALRAGMGAQFRLPCAPADDGALSEWATETGTSLWVAATDGAPIRELTLSGPVALVLGNEGAGVRPGLNRVATARVAVPLAPGAESLNVAVAAGILLYEVTRDR